MQILHVVELAVTISNIHLILNARKAKIPKSGSRSGSTYLIRKPNQRNFVTEICSI